MFGYTILDDFFYVTTIYCWVVSVRKTIIIIHICTTKAGNGLSWNANVYYLLCRGQGFVFPFEGCSTGVVRLCIKFRKKIHKKTRKKKVKKVALEVGNELLFIMPKSILIQPYVVYIVYVQYISSCQLNTVWYIIIL